MTYCGSILKQLALMVMFASFFHFSVLGFFCHSYILYTTWGIAAYVRFMLKLCLCEVILCCQVAKNSQAILRGRHKVCQC